MAKSSPTFVCQNCGAAFNRWQGKCEACGEWNTLSEEGSDKPAGPGRKPGKGRLFQLQDLAGNAQDAPRLPSGIGELDRVTGGGFVRGSVQPLIRFAKRSGAAVILVGHVTKDGQIAGPRVVEHMVDAVLSFEGEGSHQFRILRAVKNRFGPTDEIGVFEMTGEGLSEITNPSELFLSERDLGSPGTAVFAGIEGTRPLLVEIQALVAKTSLGTPRRAVNGWDQNRLSMLLAVLESHCGVRLSGHDV